MIELHGVIQFKDGGHTFVDVVVMVGGSGRHVKHRLGVDIVVNRGRIITFLGKIYGVPPGDIVWPAHIEL